MGRPRKNVRKSNTVQSTNSKGICKSRKVGDSSLVNAPMLKPMSHQQRCFAQQHHCFLLRNLEKVRRLKSSINQVQVQNGKTKCSSTHNIKEKNSGDSKTQSDAFFSQLTALTNTNARTVRTRRLAQAQDDPEVHKTAKLAKVHTFFLYAKTHLQTNRIYLQFSYFLVLFFFILFLFFLFFYIGAKRFILCSSER